MAMCIEKGYLPFRSALDKNSNPILSSYFLGDVMKKLWAGILGMALSAGLMAAPAHAQKG